MLALVNGDARRRPCRRTQELRDPEELPDVRLLARAARAANNAPALSALHRGCAKPDIAILSPGAFSTSATRS